MRAQFIAKLPDGRRVSRYPVEYLFNSSRPDASLLDWTTPRIATTDVLACTPREAADWALAQVVGIPNVEVTVYGPKGGEAARRFQGWESAVWSAMCANPAPRQAKLELE